MFTNEDSNKKGQSASNVRLLLERHPSHPWMTENLSQVLHQILASDVIREDSDSSIDATTLDDSDVNILRNNHGFGREPRISRITRAADSREIRPKNKSSKRKPPKGTDSKQSMSMEATTPSLLSKEMPGDEAKKLKKAVISSEIRKPSLGFSTELQASTLQMKDSDLIDLGKISSRLVRSKQKFESEREGLPPKIIPRVNEMINAIKTAMKYDLQPENFRDEDELEAKMELNRMLRLHKELDSFGVKELSKSQYKQPSIKGIPTFSYLPLHPNYKHQAKPQTCNCTTCKMNRIWVETKRMKADELVPFLAESRKPENVTKVWNCQCKGPRPGFNNKNQMLMKLRVPQGMRPDELKKLNSVPRMEIYKHITPAANDGVNIKNAVFHKPQPSRPIIQQELMCHTNEMRCVLLPPPFTGKVAKFETPDWVVEYNKRYVYDYFFAQSKTIPNVSFIHFSYKKNLAVLTEEIIQGCMNRTDIFDDDTCQCTFLCTCAHKTVKNPNETLFDIVRKAKKYCAADLFDDNTYEASDYMKSGDKTYFVCSKLCNAKMKLHKQLHV